MDEVEAEILKDELAVRRARLDQLEEMLWRQYDTRPPRVNRMRLDMLDKTKFGIELDQWNINAYFETQGES